MSEKVKISGAQQHWEAVYASQSDAELSWSQGVPATSLALIGEACPSGRNPAGAVIDVGGGTSLLCEKLLDLGYSVTVLDISAGGLNRARARLGKFAEAVRWILADVAAGPELGTFDVWHDRAVFHFLTAPTDRAAYVALLARTVPPGGHAILATFAPDGPEKCSGLEVRRYDGPGLAAELGGRFEPIKSVPEMHLTPWGVRQSFQYSLFRRI